MSIDEILRFRRMRDSRGKKRLLTAEQEALVLRRATIARENCTKRIANDLGCSTETIRMTVRRYLGPWA